MKFLNATTANAVQQNNSYKFNVKPSLFKKRARKYFPNERVFTFKELNSQAENINFSNREILQDYLLYLCLRHMSIANDHIRQMGGILSEILMLVFIVASSWSHVPHKAPTQNHEVVIGAAQAEDFAFIDSGSATEILISFIAKASYIGEALTYQALAPVVTFTANQEQFQLSPSLFNTFYTYVSTKAP